MSFLNAHWYDSSHIQSNKIVSSEIKDNWVLLEPSYGKKRRNLLANPIVEHMKLISRGRKCNPFAY